MKEEASRSIAVKENTKCCQGQQLTPCRVSEPRIQLLSDESTREFGCVVHSQPCLLLLLHTVKSTTSPVERAHYCYLCVPVFRRPYAKEETGRRRVEALNLSLESSGAESQRVETLLGRSNLEGLQSYLLKQEQKQKRVLYLSGTHE